MRRILALLVFAKSAFEYPKAQGLVIEGNEIVVFKLPVHFASFEATRAAKQQGLESRHSRDRRFLSHIVCVWEQKSASYLTQVTLIGQDAIVSFITSIMLILDGKVARDSFKKALISRVKALSVAPKLALIQVGNNKESAIYIEQKKKFANSIGALVEHIHFPENATFDHIKDTISKLNSDAQIHGIIIQLPLSAHLDKLALMNLIDPKKDVDGLTDYNQKLLESGKPNFIPATAKGIGMLLDFYNIHVSGKKVTVLGRSRLVGHPTAMLMASRGASVTVCHSGTKNTATIAKQADILIVAIGKPELIDASYVKQGAIVIDVGINSVAGEKFEEEIPRRKVAGDVNFKSVSGICSALTPVPGGIGPMTVLSLFDNLVVSAENSL
jgi:methylenetetrahydrofolate dehydrogenase (NADP+)/methenyltetrahydrofolate cyclohydrolase